MTLWDPDPEEYRPLAVLDFEASALENGYPIEVAVCRVDDGAEVWSRLIRPTDEWLRTRHWSPEAEALHGIAMDELMRDGLPAARVADELEHAVAGVMVLSDSALDDGWLICLFTAADPPRPAPFRLEGFWPQVDLLAGGLPTPTGGGRSAEMVERAKQEALRRFPRLHRTGDDARRLAEIIRILGGLA